MTAPIPFSLSRLGIYACRFHLLLSFPAHGSWNSVSLEHTTFNIFFTVLHTQGCSHLCQFMHLKTNILLQHNLVFLTWKPPRRGSLGCGRLEKGEMKLCILDVCHLSGQSDWGQEAERDSGQRVPLCASDEIPHLHQSNRNTMCIWLTCGCLLHLRFHSEVASRQLVQESVWRHVRHLWTQQRGVWMMEIWKKACSDEPFTANKENRRCTNSASFHCIVVPRDNPLRLSTSCQASVVRSDLASCSLHFFSCL